MKKYLICTMVLLIALLLNGCNSSVKKATLNVGSEKTLEMGNIKYKVSRDTISKDNLDGKVGRVNKVVKTGSPYPETYQDMKNVYKVKDKKIEEQAVIESNGSFYLLTPIKE